MNLFSLSSLYSMRHCWYEILVENELELMRDRVTESLYAVLPNELCNFETWNLPWTLMQKILSKFRRHDHRDVGEISRDTPDLNITIQQVFHYRKQKGVNFGTFCFRHCPVPILTNAGSWFVLERWITDSPFQHAFQPAQSDLDVARSTNAKHILERHWDTWITEEDWLWISEHGINTVRIPVSCFLLMFI